MNVEQALIYYQTNFGGKKANRMLSEGILTNSYVKLLLGILPSDEVSLLVYECKHTEATYKMERITDVFQKLFTLSETILKDYSMVEDGQKVMAAKDSNETTEDVSKLHKKISVLEKEVKRKEERRTEPPATRERKNEEVENKTIWKSPISDPIKCNKFTLKLFNSALTRHM